MLKKSLIVLFSILICTIFLFKAQKHIPAAPKDDDHNNQTIFEDAMERALLSQDLICYTYIGSTIHHKDATLLELTENDNNEDNAPQFSVIDLDQDGTPEIVYQRGGWGGFIVIRYFEGLVLGYDLPVRGMQELKQDGTFRTSNSSAEGSISRLHFWGRFYDFEDLWRFWGKPISNNQDTVWIVTDATLSKSSLSQGEFEIFLGNFSSQPGVVWHPYNTASIEELLHKELEPYGPISYPIPTARQMYLDKLTDLKYVLLEEDYPSYATGCEYAMQEVYKKCMELLSPEDIDTLESKYIQWQSRWLKLRTFYSGIDDSGYYVGESAKQWMYYLMNNYLSD